jgi:ribonucleotide reductase beta subunit family protein with ferritin-like domain
VFKTANNVEQQINVVKRDVTIHLHMIASMIRYFVGRATDCAKEPLVTIPRLPPAFLQDASGIPL